MRILLLTQHYHPETMATGRRARELAEDFAAVGHDVIVIAGRPNHPSTLPRGPVDAAARERPAPRLEVVRVPVIAGPQTGFGRRLLTYGSFAVSAVAGALAQGRRPDVVVAISPLPTGLAAATVATLLRAPLVFDLQDVWPESAAIAGVFAGGPAYAALATLESALYRRCAAVTVITRGFEQRLRSRHGLPAPRVRYVPNGVDVDFFRREQANEALMQRYRLGESFTVLFAGNMGLMQDLDTALDAAKLLADDPTVRLVLAGEGVRRAHLERRVREERIANVTMVAGQPRALVPDLYHLADAAIVSLIDRPLFTITVPSKTYECMAAAKPILCGVRGETRSIIEAAGCGIAYEPGDARSLTGAVRAMQSADRATLGANGRRWVEANATRAMVARDYLALLAEVAG